MMVYRWIRNIQYLIAVVSLFGLGMTGCTPTNPCRDGFTPMHIEVRVGGHGINLEGFEAEVCLDSRYRATPAQVMNYMLRAKIPNGETPLVYVRGYNKKPQNPVALVGGTLDAGVNGRVEIPCFDGNDGTVYCFERRGNIEDALKNFRR